MIHTYQIRKEQFYFVSFGIFFIINEIFAFSTIFFTFSGHLTRFENCLNFY